MLNKNKTVDIIWSLIGGFILAIFFTNSIFAGTTISGPASCRMPSLIGFSDNTNIVAEETVNTENPQDSIMFEREKTELQEREKNFIAENKTDLIQTEEIISKEDNKEIQIITTVCAK